MTSALIFSALRNSPLLIRDETVAQVFSRSGLPAGDLQEELSFNQKLGHLYEDGLAALIQHSSRYDLLEKGLQIQSDRHHTLGELDFLVRDRESGGLVHLELAVKFYLAIESAEDGLLLPGPDARDNYYKKLAHLRTHQLTLTQRHRDTLPQPYREEKITPQHLVIGCLFQHVSASKEMKVDGLHSSHRRGQWLRQSEFLAYIPKESPAMVIPKPLWPVPCALLSDELQPLDLETPLTRCVMVRLEGEERPLFITPDNYPEMEDR